ncbi:carboxypeptidase-like regulatory domain-containing protein [Aurantibacter sp.]|uniref:carboxypeptidase-like regulatory domain-containing protein n=1 Tax=Aurantibacter sp. TaxID=2807103 RepID=UPI003265F2DD
MKKLYIIIILIGFTFANAQDDTRTLLRGQVIYRDVNVPNENVINITTEMATITNANGQFAIKVKEGDELAFTALNYELEVVKITAAIIENNRLVVEVNEKVTELDEVVVSPEDKEKFLQAQNEKFKEVEYEIDRTTEVENISLSQSERGMKDGINFINIFKAIMASGKNKEKESLPKLKPSEVLRQVYSDDFFVLDLKLPQDKIENFLYFVDENMDERALLKKDNEFQLLDFLVNQSREYRTQMDADK